ncbi:MAG: glycosyltransferase, partial [Bacteroidota bacterium]
INWLPEGKLYNWLNKINHSIVARAIKRAIRRLGIDEYDFINSHDYYFAQIHQLLNNEGKYIYQCLDPIIKAYSARHGHRLEQEAAIEADLVISTSPTLKEKMLAYNPNSILVPNAANFSLCHQALKPETNTIPAIDSLEGLKFGYIGNIERRIDYSLLLNVFTAHPDWQLIMVGPIDESFIPNEFFELKNLTLLPPVPHHQVPEVLKSLDIAIIPFVCDEVSAQIYPLKMYEYLASGKPVITTDFNPEVIGALASAVNIANDFEQFFEQVELIKAIENESLVQDRVNVARQNDWSQRSEMILNLI